MNVPRALQAFPFVGVLERDEQGRAVVFSCPSSPREKDGKRGYGSVNIIKVEWKIDKEIYVSCWKDGDECIAVRGSTVCYHCLAAMLVRAEEAGWVVDIRDKPVGEYMIVRTRAARAFFCLRKRA